MRNRDVAGAGPMPCQPAEHRDFSRLSRPFSLVLLGRAWWYLRNHGLRAALCQTADWLRTPRRRISKADTRPGYVEALGLKAGDWAEVKSEAEIRQTLDLRGATRGLKFLTGMVPKCGQRFRVHKRLETMFLEESRQIRKTRNTVLLEGVYCDGAGYGCDRSCFFYWREAWLKKVDGPAPGGEVRS